MHPAQLTQCVDKAAVHVAPSDRNVVVVGACNVDVVASTAAPIRGGDSVPGHVVLRPGGVGRNVAHNLAALQCPTQLLSVVGDDWLGQLLLQACGDAGIGTAGIQVLAHTASASYVTVHDATGDTAAAINAMGALDQLTPALLQPHMTQLAAANAVVLDCNLPQDSLHALCHELDHTALFVDGVSSAKVSRLHGLFHLLHTLKINALEANTLCSQPCDTPAQAALCANTLHNLGCQRVLISLGAQGFVYAKAGQSAQHVAPPNEQPAQPNTTGAGDALLAGMVYGFVQQLSLADTLACANACAALTLLSPHANHPDLSPTYLRTHAALAL